MIRAEIGQILHTDTHTRRKLVVEISPQFQDTRHMVVDLDI